MCERSSKFLPGPLSHAPLRVDDFSKGAMVYFLTHAHTDHVKGLRNTWREGRIYCTEVTKRLIRLKYPGLDERLFRILRVGETKLIMLNESYSVCVTVLDAMHCAGSCMFLFESKQFGRVLHTGDFRYEIGQTIPQALMEVEEGVTTSVYLDNTYGLQSSPRNPSRRAVRDVLISVLALYPESTRFVFCMHGLGKEELLVEVARAFSSQVLVDDERLEQILAFGETDWEDTFTSNVSLKDKCRVVCIRRGGGGRLGEENEAEPDGAENVRNPNEEPDMMLPGAENVSFRDALGIGGENDIFITPSGWCGLSAFENMKHLLVSPSFRVLPKSIKVPYSLHASFDELVHFVKTCAFQYVIPIVNISASHRDELGIESIAKRWAKPESAQEEAFTKAEMFPKRSASFVQPNRQRRSNPELAPYLPEIKSNNRVMASPESHKRRLELKRTRFQQSPTRVAEDDGFEIVLRRQGNVTSDHWSEDEDAILQAMRLRRETWDCAGHEVERKKLRRSDQEIFLRMTLLRMRSATMTGETMRTEVMRSITL